MFLQNRVCKFKSQEKTQRKLLKSKQNFLKFNTISFYLSRYLYGCNDVFSIPRQLHVTFHWLHITHSTLFTKPVVYVNKSAFKYSTISVYLHSCYWKKSIQWIIHETLITYRFGKAYRTTSLHLEKHSLSPSFSSPSTNDNLHKREIRFNGFELKWFEKT